MLEVIERSYADHITLDTLSTTLDRQAAYLGHLFRKEVGMTVRARVTALRLDHAAALIREGVKIEAVALLVGYRGRRNFYRQFRRKFGTTPFEFGRRAQASMESKWLSGSLRQGREDLGAVDKSMETTHRRVARTVNR